MNMMQKFKQRWEIQHNWQLIFPLLGILGLLYSAYKLALLFVEETPMYISVLITLVITFVLLKFILFLFKKLENRWILNYRWEMIRVFMVFAITGSSSVFVGKPIIKLFGITKDNLNPSMYWILYIFIGIIFYQILLVCFAWIFGQFQFFWNFEKKMLSRMGLKRFFND
jgi:hypothetical protein